MTTGRPAASGKQPTTSYETIRAAVLSGHTNGHGGLAIITHRGLTAWISELMSKAPLPTPRLPISAPCTRSIDPVATPNELTRVLAGIIIALTTGNAAANA